jgi:hypothetical protein
MASSKVGVCNMIKLEKKNTYDLIITVLLAVISIVTFSYLYTNEMSFISLFQKNIFDKEVPITIGVNNLLVLTLPFIWAAKDKNDGKGLLINALLLVAMMLQQSLITFVVFALSLAHNLLCARSFKNYLISLVTIGLYSIFDLAYLPYVAFFTIIIFLRRELLGAMFIMLMINQIILFNELPSYEMLVGFNSLLIIVSFIFGGEFLLLMACTYIFAIMGVQTGSYGLFSVSLIIFLVLLTKEKFLNQQKCSNCTQIHEVLISLVLGLIILNYNNWWIYVPCALFLGASMIYRRTKHEV